MKMKMKMILAAIFVIIVALCSGKEIYICKETTKLEGFKSF
jgi:hypothetical protein